MLAHHITDTESLSSDSAAEPVLGTPTTATSGRSAAFRNNGAPNPAELAEDLAQQFAAGLLPTPTVGDQREGKHLRSIAVENLKNGKNRGIGLNHLTEAIGVDWNEGDQFVVTENGVEKVDALLPTPNTMDNLYARTPEKIAESKKRSPAGYRNLREAVVNEIPTPLLPTPLAQDGSGSMPPEERLANGYRPHLRDVEYLLPTPVVNDMGGNKTPEQWDEWCEKVKAKHNNSNRHGPSLNIEAIRLLPTPIVDDGKNTGHNNKRFPSLASVAHQELLPTPKARDHAPEGYEAGLRRHSPQLGTVMRAMAEDETTVDWGKFAPAIRRWEKVIGRRAPEPTRPDGKDQTHRLNPKFTEWMMGLPDGWLTDIGLSRNNELKACGNGVVPQQAALALRQMLAIVDTLND
jgi:hypothetical protein